MIASSGKSYLSRFGGFLCMLLLALCIVPAGDAEACADIDLVCRITALDQQLGVTNQAVTGLNSVIGTLSTTMSSLQTAISTIAVTFDQLSKDMIKVVGLFMTTAETISSDTMMLTSDLVMRIQDARKLMDFFIEYERDSYLAFVGSNGCSAECEAFRGQLILLLGHVESTTNLGFEALASQLLVDSTLPPPPIPKLDLGMLKQVLQQAPGVVLFSLYRSIPVISVEGEPPPGISYCEPGNPSCALALLNGILGRAEESFEVVIELAQASSRNMAMAKQASVTTSGGFGSDTCLYWAVGDMVPGISKMSAAEYGSSTLAVLGGIMKGLGLALESFAMSGLTEEVLEGGGSVAIHAGVGIHSNKARVIGGIGRILGGIMVQVGQGLEEKLGECRMRLNNGVIMCWISVKNPIKGNANQQSTYQWCVDQVKSGASF